MIIAIYARVSSETQSKDGTIQSQLEVLREYAKSENLTVIEECIDDGFSGADLNRPGMDHIRDLAGEGLIKGILVLSPDRLARKQAHQIILMEEFKKRNIQVIFSNMQIGDSAEDQLLLQIQGAIAEYERAQILDRTRRGRKHADRRGQVLGSNTPYGYRYVHKTRDIPGHWEVEPHEAEIVKLIFDWYVNEGLKSPSIIRRLNEEGYTPRSGRKWWASTIFDILKNETYTGTAYMYKHKSVEPKKHPKLYKYRKRRKSSKTPYPKEERIAIAVTHIIDHDIWEKAQVLLKKNAYRSRRNNKKNNYLLRGLVVCGLCGSMAPGYVSNKKTYYCCGAKRNKNLTTKHHEENVLVRHNVLDEKVWTRLVNLLDDPKELKAQMGKRLQKLNHNVEQDRTTMNEFEKSLLRLSVQESRIIDAYRESIIDLDELKEQKAKIAKKRNVLEVKRNTALREQEGSERTEITMGMLGDLSDRYQRAMSKANFQTREKLANLLIDRVTLHPEKAIMEGNIPISNDDALIPWNRSSPKLTKNIQI